MKTWSAEELFVKAYGLAAVTVQAVLDAVWPPKFDGGAGGEWLESYSGGGTLGFTEEDAEWVDPPNPYEPQLSDDELVGVRELLERFGLANVPTPSTVGTSPAGVEHTPVPPAGIPVSIHDLRQAADLIGALGHPDDPRDYDYGALAERLSGAADHLAQPNK